MHGMKILRNRRGAVAAASAVLMVGVVGIAGLAIDLTRIWMVNARLKTAIDAASLVAARQISVAQATRDALVDAVYWANFSRNGNVYRYLGATATNPTITQLSETRIQVTGSASVPTTLFGVIAPQSTIVSDSAIAQRQGIGLELALVLDVTGSLGVSNMQAVRSAARDLVNILYGNNERQPDLWVSVVPYTATVNIGRGHESWLAINSLNQANYAPTIWRGCVEARAGVDYAYDADQDDTPPSLVPFRPFFWPSNRTRYSHPVDPNNTSRLLFNQVLTNAQGAPRNRGDNPWIPPRRGQTAPTNIYADAPYWNGDAAFLDGRVQEPNPEAPVADDQTQENLGNYANGPNLGCPRAILPLTRDKTPILNQIAALRHTHRGGTMANLGLQMGWATLSPRWRAEWNLAETRDGQQLPLAYNTRNMRKAIVLMTDGNNEWHDSDLGAPGNCTTNNISNTASGLTPARPACVGTASPLTQAQTMALLTPLSEGTWGVSGTNVRNVPNDADLTAYGRLRTNRMGVANATIASARDDSTNGIDARMVRLCQAVRAEDRNITVYTITFGGSPSTATRTLYENCASTPGNYYHAPTQTVLSQVFQTIAGQLANLRLVQ
jgi:Flp pilus assembly protein TadG